ncbi:MAG: OmpH family outer membrane protein [Candidatus Hydrogenedentes bacterium]|nr:OmpH family outer membrane protein [Candidatus Hydrogenedentota bacterium]
MITLRARIIVALCLLALAAALPLRATAQDSPGAYKIGVVVMSDLLKDYKKREAKYADLETKVKELQAPIDALSTKITAMKENYDKNAPEMDADKRLTLESEIKNEYASYQAQLKESQQRIDILEEQVLKEVLSDIKDTITEVADREGYHLVLDGGGRSGGSVLYFANSINITPKILAELNKSSK